MLKAKLLMPVMKTLNESETAFAAPAKKDAYPKEVIELAMELFKKYETMESVLQTFRKIYQYGDLRFTISLREKSEAQKQEIRELLEKMKGLVGNYIEDQELDCISGVLEQLPRATNFLSGGYLEIAIGEETKRIVQELADRYQKPWSVKTNVILPTPDGSTEHELDVMIQFDHIRYVVEVKSGIQFRNYTKYYNIGRKYEIIPNRILLVGSCFTESEINQTEYFAEYYVANLKNFQKKLVEMIEADIQEVKVCMN